MPKTLEEYFDETIAQELEPGTPPDELDGLKFVFFAGANAYRMLIDEIMRGAADHEWKDALRLLNGECETALRDLIRAFLKRN